MAFFVSMPTMATNLTDYSKTSYQAPDFSASYSYISSQVTVPDINCSACSKLNINIISSSRHQLQQAVYRYRNESLVNRLTSNIQAKPYAGVLTA